MLRVLIRNVFLGADLTPADRAPAVPDGLAELPPVVAQSFNPATSRSAVRPPRRLQFSPRRAHLGFTCCHRERLDDPADMLRARIDLILPRGAIAATEAVLVGHTPADMRSGLWPSDHAGVVAALEPV